MTSPTIPVPTGAVPIPPEPETDCPDWCTSTSTNGHGWEVFTGDSMGIKGIPYVFYRTHVREFGVVDVCQEERREFGAAESTYGDLCVWVELAEAPMMPIGTAETLASDLSAAIIAARELAARP